MMFYLQNISLPQFEKKPQAVGYQWNETYENAVPI